MTSTTNGASVSGAEKQYQVPEWEHIAVNRGSDVGNSRSSTKAAFGSKFDAILPPHKRYLRMSRRVFLWILLVVVVALLALIIGLAVGLSKSR